MFGHSEIGRWAIGEFPPIRTTFALIARVVIVPAVRVRDRAVSAILAASRLRPQ